MESSLLQVNDLSFSYRQDPCLNQVNFAVNAGEFVLLLGPNGSGKTTLLQVLAGLLTPAAGEIKIENKALAKWSVKMRAQKISFMSFEALAFSRLTIYQIVLLGRFRQLPWHGYENDLESAAVHEALTCLDLCHMKDRFFGELSLGEKQRVLIARAIAQDTQLILLDEPTSNVDIAYRIQIDAFLGDLCRQGKTVIMSSHDLNHDLVTVDRVLMLKDGTLSFNLQREDKYRLDAWQSTFGVTFHQVKLGANIQLMIPQRWK